LGELDGCDRDGVDGTEGVYDRSDVGWTRSLGTNELLVALSCWSSPSPSSSPAPPKDDLPSIESASWTSKRGTSTGLARACAISSSICPSRSRSSRRLSLAARAAAMRSAADSSELVVYERMRLRVEGVGEAERSMLKGDQAGRPCAGGGGCGRRAGGLMRTRGCRARARASWWERRLGRVVREEDGSSSGGSTDRGCAGEDCAEVGRTPETTSATDASPLSRERVLASVSSVWIGMLMLSATAQKARLGRERMREDEAAERGQVPNRRDQHSLALCSACARRRATSQKERRCSAMRCRAS